MKILDVAGTGLKVVKAAAVAVAKAIRPLAMSPRSQDAAEELRRRAEINARGAELRAARDREFFGRSRWVNARPGWLRGRR
jgi:hypothetical protein